MTNRDLLAQRFGLDGQVAIITGAAAGIGKETAGLFCEAGASVVIADQDANAATALAKELCAAGHNAIAVTCDVREEDAVQQLIARSIEHYGRINILVNSAGIFPVDNFLEASIERWDNVQAINLRGPFLCMREALKHMRAAGNGGRVINVSSAASLLPTLYDEIPYNSSKAGLNMLTQAAAMEFAGDGITINAVIPAFVLTEGAIRSGAEGPRRRGPAMNPERRLLGRLGEPAEIANAILFLASPAASYITGHLLRADGGFTIS
jgi:NAD(P)-dependent dehydrogenase (short-subunit alcohol dehydrogenase family)